MAETEPQPTIPYPTAKQKFPTLRQSLLSTFDACALGAKFDLEHRKDWTSHLAAEGQIFHRFAAKALKMMSDLGNATIDPEDGLAILRDCLRQHDVDPRDRVNIPAKLVKRLRWVVVKWCYENVFDIAHLVDVEQRLAAEVSYGDFSEVNRMITGQLDCLFAPEEDWAVVPDWKNSWALPPINEVSERGYFQQRVYGLLVMKTYSVIQRVTLRETYVRLKDKNTEAAPVREATVFRSELPAIEEELATLAENFDRCVEQGTWPLVPGEMPELWTPSPGSHCSWCPNPTACPIFPSARVEGAIESEEQAERWAAEAIVAKAAYDQRTKALKAWNGAHGPTKVRHAKDPNRVIGYRQGSRTSRPTQKEVEAALREQGADLDVKTLYKTEAVTRFEQHSHKEPEDAAVDADLMNVLEASIQEQKKTA